MHACMGDRSSHDLEVWVMAWLMHGWRLFAFPLCFAVHSLFSLCIWECVERWRRKPLYRTGEVLQVALWSCIYSLFCICFASAFNVSGYAQYMLVFDLDIDLIGEMIIYLAILSFEQHPSQILLHPLRLHRHLLPHRNPSLPLNRSRIL